VTEGDNNAMVAEAIEANSEQRKVLTVAMMPRLMKFVHSLLYRLLWGAGSCWVVVSSHLLAVQLTFDYQGRAPDDKIPIQGSECTKI